MIENLTDLAKSVSESGASDASTYDDNIGVGNISGSTFSVSGHRRHGDIVHHLSSHYSSDLFFADPVVPSTDVLITSDSFSDPSSLPVLDSQPTNEVVSMPNSSITPSIPSATSDIVLTLDVSPFPSSLRRSQRRFNPTNRLSFWSNVFPVVIMVIDTLVQGFCGNLSK
ncbi:hypothetical protein CMV_001248 [Castanea mollissima]|uniref:Uncharacterized protein n=1 Tax=Castanea mollissima TaxID=60419 RepID=A0A8J4RRX2_9ROSI|nr:hypothetical protein CMV_001248 [Castanea mollissima]